MKYPKISIVFATLNGLKDTRECLDSLAKLDYPKEKLEVIVVDNGSRDGTPEFIKLLIINGFGELTSSKRDPQPVNPLTRNKIIIKFIENKTNLGFAKAVNIGIKKALGDCIFITNNDVVLKKNYLKELVKLFSLGEKIGIVGGQILYKNPRGENTMPGFRLNLYFGWHAYDLTDLDKVREVEWFPGSAMLVKREVFDRIGLFDEGYFFGSEDYDFCLLARKVGYKIYYTPKAILYHGVAASAKKLGENKRLYLNYQSKLRFVIKNAAPLQMFTFFPAQLILGPPTSYIRFRYKTLLPLIRALKWNLDHLEETLKARKEAKKIQQ